MLDKKEDKSTQVIIASILLSAGIFIMDLMTPLGVADAIPYIAVILLSLWLPHRRHTYIAGIIVSLLTILGFFLSPSGERLSIVIANRILSLFGIWSAVIFVSKYKYSLDVINRTKESLRREKETAQKYLDVAATMFVLTNRDQTVGLINRKGCEILGYSEDEIIGKNWFDSFIPKNQSGQFKKSFNELMRGEIRPVELFENNIMTKNGEKRVISWHNSLIRDDGGEIIATLSSGIDITERKKAEDALRQANKDLKKYAEELKRSNSELEQFAYVASHDLQEPLRMVASFTQLLSRRYKDILDDNAKEFISFAVDGANRMQRLINDLLSYSRIQTKERAFNETDCEEILGQVRANLHESIEKNGAMITNDPLPAVFVDQTQMLQLFQNLIDNAIKFSGKGPPRVHLSAENKGGEWLFTVRDNGIGIDPQFNKRIFMIFQRLHSREEYPGTGIGLAICKRIVERHGGEIWVESEHEKGSTFYFTIPVKGEK